MFGALAMMILAPIAAVMLQMSLSRSREYEADHSGAELLGNGEPLARALEKIEAYAKQVPMDIDPRRRPPTSSTAHRRKVNFSNLFQTTRRPAERIARLRHQHESQAQIRRPWTAVARCTRTGGPEVEAAWISSRPVR